MPENLLKQVHLVMQAANSFLNLLLAGFLPFQTPISIGGL